MIEKTLDIEGSSEEPFLGLARDARQRCPSGETCGWRLRKEKIRRPSINNQALCAILLADRERSALTDAGLVREFHHTMANEFVYKTCVDSATSSQRRVEIGAAKTGLLQMPLPFKRWQHKTFHKL